MGVLSKQCEIWRAMKWITSWLRTADIVDKEELEAKSEETYFLAVYNSDGKIDSNHRFESIHTVES